VSLLANRESGIAQLKLDYTPGLWWIDFGKMWKQIGEINYKLAEFEKLRLEIRAIRRKFVRPGRRYGFVLNKSKGAIIRTAQ
jgi:hypothetical protein